MNIAKELTEIWKSLNFIMDAAIELKKRSVELEQRIRYLEGDPCSPPATSDDFETAEK